MTYSKMLKKDLIALLEEKDDKIEELKDELISLEDYCAELEQEPLNEEIVDNTKEDIIADLRLKLSRSGLITNELEDFLENYIRWEI